MRHDARIARLGRVVVAANRRQTIFFEPADDAIYRDLLAERCRKARRVKRVNG
jgi:hypothetical protein